VTDFASRSVFRAATVAALALALGLTLSACGRKGGLDAPPDGQGFYPLLGAQPDVDAQGRPIAPAAPKKRIPLDVLLD
jgi:predicted small lipoprotein YifL